MSFLIGDTTSTTLHAALSGLAQRQRVTADNIANINTPGFLAGRVDFESSLRGALRNGDTPSISGGTVARSLEPTNTNGNNVNLDMETVTATETGLRYQLALNALDGKYSTLRTALRTQ
jgi:flagellar basal-body rod protein FlgB